MKTSIKQTLAKWKINLKCPYVYREAIVDLLELKTTELYVSIVKPIL